MLNMLQNLGPRVIADATLGVTHAPLSASPLSIEAVVTATAPLSAAYQFADNYAGGYLTTLVGGVAIAGTAAAYAYPYAYRKYKDYKLVKDFKAALDNSDTEAAVALVPEVKSLLTTEDLLSSLQECNPACVLSVLTAWKPNAFPIEIFDTNNLNYVQELIKLGAIATPSIIQEKLLNAYENGQSESANFWFNKLCKEPYDIQLCGNLNINYTQQMAAETAKKMCAMGTSQPSLNGLAGQMVENATLSAFQALTNGTLSVEKFKNRISLIQFFKNQFNVKLDQLVQSNLSEILLNEILNQNLSNAEEVFDFLREKQLFSDTLNNPAWMDNRLYDLPNGLSFFENLNPMTTDKLMSLFYLLETCSLERPEWQSLFEKHLALTLQQASLPMFKMHWDGVRAQYQLDPNKFLTLAVKTPGAVAILQFLIEQGANSNHLNGQLLLEALNSQCFPQAKILLENGADVRTDATIFLRILESGNEELISCLYQNGLPGFFVNNQSKEIYERVKHRKISPSADCYVPNKWEPITHSETLPEALELLQNTASTVYNYDSVDHKLPTTVIPTLQFLAKNQHTEKHKDPIKAARDFANAVDAFEKDVELINACKIKTAK